MEGVPAREREGVEIKRAVRSQSRRVAAPAALNL